MTEPTAAHREDERHDDAPLQADDPLDELDFDRAELEDEDDLEDDGAAEADQAAGAFCTACGAEMWDAYYDVDGTVACEACVRVLRYGPPGSSAGGRAARAIALGGIAAILSGLVWYGIAALTGLEIGLIAIAVGLAVGFAVRIGSGHMGGWFYQGVAMTLTYLAIVGTYVPDLMDMMRNPPPEGEEVSVLGGPATAHAQPAESSAPAAPVGDEEAMEPLPTPILFVLACMLSLFAPILAGFENIIGLAIIAFALWEAWKVNKRPYKQISGPFALGAPADG